MINFRELDYFSMTYVFIEDDEDVVCEYEQTAAPITLAADGSCVTFTLKNIDADEDAEEYSVTLGKMANDEFYLQSSYFEDATERYSLSVDVLNEEVKFTLAGEDEVMYLYGFFA